MTCFTNNCDPDLLLFKQEEMGDLLDVDCDLVKELCKELDPSTVLPNDPFHEDACPVCGSGKVNKHSNYGGRSCSSCRVFFQRSVVKRDCMQFYCVNGNAREGSGKCLINSRSWQSCQYCRFQSCLKSGMKPELVYRSQPQTLPLESMQFDREEIEKVINLSAIYQNNIMMSFLTKMCLKEPSMFLYMLRSYTTRRSLVTEFYTLEPSLAACSQLGQLSALTHFVPGIFDRVPERDVDILSAANWPVIHVLGTVMSSCMVKPEPIVVNFFEKLFHITKGSPGLLSSGGAVYDENVEALALMVAEMGVSVKIPKRNPYHRLFIESLGMQQDQILANHLREKVMKWISSKPDQHGKVKANLTMSETTQVILLCIVLGLSSDGLTDKLQNSQEVERIQSQYLGVLYRFLCFRFPNSANAKLAEAIDIMKLSREALSCSNVAKFVRFS